MEGFEPSNVGARIQCLTAWRHPKVDCACSNPARACLLAAKPIFTIITSQAKRAQATLVAQLVCFLLMANLAFSLSVLPQTIFLFPSFEKSYTYCQYSHTNYNVKSDCIGFLAQAKGKDLVKSQGKWVGNQAFAYWRSICKVILLKTLLWRIACRSLRERKTLWGE